MATIHEIKIEPMTEESFAPFGELRDTADRPGDRRVSSPTAAVKVSMTYRKITRRDPFAPCSYATLTLSEIRNDKEA